MTRKTDSRAADSAIARLRGVVRALEEVTAETLVGGLLRTSFTAARLA